MSDPPVEENSDAPVEETPPSPIKFGDESLSDVTLSVENQDFIVHRMVLASRSPYFKAMFFGDFKESKEDRVEIKRISPDIFKRIVEIIYNGAMSDNSPLAYMFTLKKLGDCGFLYHEDPFLNTDSEEDRETLKKFWDFVNELLPAADLLDVSELVLQSLQKEISTKHCRNKDCGFCLNLYMFAFMKEMPILDVFPEFTRNRYLDWSRAVYKIKPRLIPVSFQAIDSERMSILIKKFT